jgi:hypothetical protein
VELEQPIFGANYIKGKVRAQPGGNFTGKCQLSNFFECFGTGSGLDAQVSGSGSEFLIRIQEGKNDPQNQKNVKNFHVLK